MSKTAPVYLEVFVRKHLIVEAASLQLATEAMRDDDCIVLSASYTPPEEELHEEDYT